jgi:hypothetical protein
MHRGGALTYWACIGRIQGAIQPRDKAARRQREEAEHKSTWGRGHGQADRQQNERAVEKHTRGWGREAGGDIPREEDRLGSQGWLGAEENPRDKKRGLSKASWEQRNATNQSCKEKSHLNQMRKTTKTKASID